jgi:hypothetical protein
MWGAWADREGEFYVEAAKLIDALEWRDIRTLLGAAVTPAIEELEARYRALRSTALPERLTARNDELALVQIGRKFVRADSYRAHDPVRMPKELLDLLPDFDGTPVAEAIAKIEREKGVRLEAALVRKLADFGLLVER